MKKSILNLALVGLIFSSTLVACDQTNSKGTEVKDSTTTVIDSTQKTAITVERIADSKEFPGAELKIASITSEKLGTDSVKVTVKYAVNNFKLTEQTAHDHHMANSHDGQHIHFILDNKPYVALYKPEQTVTLAINSEHYLLSFLSRSFHESIKTSEASKLVKFKIDQDGKIIQEATVTAPSLFYSRPKGEYKGEDTKVLLLDFFLVNTKLAADGNKVIADINGQQFPLDHWGPYEIKGLPLGDAKVKLTLVDKDGNAITGDNVSVERDIKLLAK